MKTIFFYALFYVLLFKLELSIAHKYENYESFNKKNLYNKINIMHMIQNSVNKININSIYCRTHANSTFCYQVNNGGAKDKESIHYLNVKTNSLNQYNKLENIKKNDDIVPTVNNNTLQDERLKTTIDDSQAKYSIPIAPSNDIKLNVNHKEIKMDIKF